ncbi:MAG: DUF4401 domain-containing protein [Gemmatimonadetes bacterium]|nr:DUF4401 domain-containing protein [Gemmatimonadota bacterium]NNF14760.1 DUF4401 domain-containing protein [Gemmatimonadota bacterium]
MKPDELAEALVQRGFILSDAEPRPPGPPDRPWYVSLVLGASGWLASLSGFVFVMLLFEPDSTGDFVVGGLLLLGSGYGLYVADREGAFFEQLALALSLAGQLLLIWAVGESTESAAAAAGFAALMCSALVFALPNHFARTLSALFACIAWALAVRLTWWGEDALWDQRVAVPLAPALVAWALIWLPVAFGVHHLIGREARWMATKANRIARPAITGLLVALSIGTWTSEPFAALSFWVPTEVATSWLSLWPLLGVAAALFAALSAYRLQSRALIGVAIAGALLHVVHFYYLLGVRLVVKSYIMLAVGVLLVLAARHMAGRLEHEATR